MKLKDNFITHETDGKQILLAIDGSFSGIVRLNYTASFIIECLKNEITENALIDAVCEQYDAPRDAIARDVEAVLSKLRTIGALNE